jgi:phage minor structural protein
MYPTLYEQIDNVGTVPVDNGLGILTDCLECMVTEERNGIYELTLKYPTSGIHAKELKERRILKAKPNYTDDPQLFRIYNIGKELNGSFTVNARHITYDLSGYVITTGTAVNAGDACLLLEEKTPGWTITTDKDVTANFNIYEPSSVRSWFGGKEGSLLDVYGTAEWKYDNFECKLLQHRGVNRGVKVKYAKNLLTLTQDLDSDNVITGVLPFWKDSQTNEVIIGQTQSTSVSLDVPNVYTLDCSSTFQEKPTVAQLNTEAIKYISNHNTQFVKQNIKLDFLQIGQLKDRVDLCDIVEIEYPDFNISGTAKCITTKWDVIKERYDSIEIGEPKTNISDTIVSVEKSSQNAITQTQMSGAISRATALITGNSGGYIVMHDNNGDGQPDELLIMNAPDISTATKVWRWNLSGLGYSNTGYDGNYGLAMTIDGEIVADKVSTGVLQDQAGNNSWNLNSGAAHFKSLSVVVGSSTKQVGSALNSLETNKVGTNEVRTKFAADATSITIQSGTITFKSNTFVVNSTNFSVTNTGVVKASDFSANSAIKLYNSSWGTKYAEIGVITSGNQQFPAFNINHSNGTPRVKIYSNPSGSNVGTVETYGSNGKMAASLSSASTGGYLKCYDTNAVSKAEIGSIMTIIPGGGTGDAGQIVVKDVNASATINLAGASGNVRCVSLTQTSSRKAKENIKDLTEDEARKVLNLKPVTYDFKNKSQGTNMRGFIAEDVLEVIPELVKKDEELPSLDYIAIIPYLTKMVQLQENRINKLEGK